MALAIALGAVSALGASVLFSRNDAKWTRVEVVRASREEVVIRVRNTHGERRRIWVRGLDVSESLFEGGANIRLFGESPDPLPIAGARRFAIRHEIAARQWLDLPLRLEGVTGPRRGTADVILDGSSWIRVEIALE